MSISSGMSIRGSTGTAGRSIKSIAPFKFNSSIRWIYVVATNIITIIDLSNLFIDMIIAAAGQE